MNLQEPWETLSQYCSMYPHLKGLIDSQNISGWQERGSTFTYKKTHLKIPILLHREPRPYLFSVGSVAPQHFGSLIIL